MKLLRYALIALMFIGPAQAAGLQVLGDLSRGTVIYQGAKVTMTQLSNALATVASESVTGLTTDQAALIASALQPTGIGTGLSFTSGTSTINGSSMLSDVIANAASIVTLNSDAATTASTLNTDGLAISNNGSAITTEVARAKAAETTLSNQITSGATATSLLRNFNAEAGTAYTVVAADCTLNKVIQMKGTAASTVTYPSGLPSGCDTDVEQDTTGTVTIANGSGITFPAKTTGKTVTTAGIGQSTNVIVSGAELIARNFLLATAATTTTVTPVQNVFEGGYVGFTNLSLTSAKAALATGRVGLYMHGNAVSAANSAADIAILKAFAPYGGGYFEAGQNTFFNSGDAYDTYLGGKLAGAWVPQYMVLNTDNNDYIITNKSGSEVADAEAWMLKVRTRFNLPNLPIAEVNTPSGTDGYLQDAFATSTQWANIRTLATYGKAFAIDIPVNNFLTQYSISPYNWGEFLESQIKWCNSQGIATVAILSPNAGYTNVYYEQVQQVEAKLVADGATPSQWVVENYDTTLSTTVSTVETTPEDVNISGLWLSKNVP